MNDEVIIEGSKRANIKRIKQRLTYDGLLAGLPTKELNQIILTKVQEEAKKFCMLNEVFLIEPEEPLIEYEGFYRPGVPARLPRVICIAELRYHSDAEIGVAALGLIWFQDDFAFPIDADVLEKIKAVPFSKICGQYFP
ncbi:hypothetical protein ACTHGU_01785 [Chitinophagaceae bacterium MMS25-I14]